MGMRASGLVSGMDTDALIKKMLDAQRIPLKKVAQKKQVIEWQRDDYRALNNKLLEFKNSAFDMKLSTVYHARQTFNSNESSAAVTATSSAMEGSYSLEISSLATSASANVSKLKDSLLDENGIIKKGFSINVTGEKGTVSVSAAENQSIQSFIALVNSHSSSTGVKAGYDANLDTVFFNSTTTGEKSSIKVTATGDASAVAIFNIAETKGTDAKIKFNGVEGSYATNSFQIAGINITAKQKNTSTTINVTQDVEASLESIKGFVEKYNTLISEINTKLAEKKYKDFKPLTTEEKDALSEKEVERWEEKARSGNLKNDSLLASGLLELRRSLSDTVSSITGGQLRNLGDIGISNVNVNGKVVSGDYSDRGKLYIDENKLRKAITEKPDEVYKLFTKSDGATFSENGIVTRLHTKADELFKKITERAGTLNALEDDFELGKQTKELTKQEVRLERKIQDLEKRYYKQFTAMETYLNKMNAQSAWLAQQFGGSS